MIFAVVQITASTQASNELRNSFGFLNERKAKCEERFPFMGSECTLPEDI
jgi:hypothetical protein